MNDPLFKENLFFRFKTLPWIFLNEVQNFCFLYVSVSHKFQIELLRFRLSVMPWWCQAFSDGEPFFTNPMLWQATPDYSQLPAVGGGGGTN